METNKLNVPDMHTKYYKQWSIFTIICESDFSKIHICFPTITHAQVAKFITDCLKTDPLELEDERSIERALTAIQQPGAEHVPFTVSSTRFHLYYTNILEPVFI